MVDQVSKTHRLDHPFCQLHIQVTVFFQQVEHFICTARHTEALLADDVRRDVDAILHSHLKIEQDTFLPVEIRYKRPKVRVSFFENTALVSFQRTGFRQYQIQIPVNQWINRHHLSDQSRLHPIPVGTEFGDSGHHDHFMPGQFPLIPDQNTFSLCKDLLPKFLAGNVQYHRIDILS
jgi:hypothetical protein